MESEFHSKLKGRLVDVGEPRFNLAHEDLLNIIIDADVILESSVVFGHALTKKEWDTLSIIIDDLIRYTKLHFTEEEHFLRTYGYPDADQHQLEHHALVEKLNNNKKVIMLNDEANLKDVRIWLLEWLFNHVNNRDYAYAQYFSKINKSSL